MMMYKLKNRLIDNYIKQLEIMRNTRMTLSESTQKILSLVEQGQKALDEIEENMNTTVIERIFSEMLEARNRLDWLKYEYSLETSCVDKLYESLEQTINYYCENEDSEETAETSQKMLSLWDELIGSDEISAEDGAVKTELENILDSLQRVHEPVILEKLSPESRTRRIARHRERDAMLAKSKNSIAMLDRSIEKQTIARLKARYEKEIIFNTILNTVSENRQVGREYMPKGERPGAMTRRERVYLSVKLGVSDIDGVYARTGADPGQFERGLKRIELLMAENPDYKEKLDLMEQQIREDSEWIIRRIFGE